MTRFTLILLGGASLVEEGRSLAGRVVQRRQLALLALLASYRDRPASRDKLIACLWPETGETTARHSLSDALHVIRKELGEDAVLSERDEIRLNLEVVTCDVWEFEAALEEEDRERAVGLYAGPFLDGFFVSGDSLEFESWAASERERLQRAYVEALERLAESKAAAGDPWRAADWWRRLCAETPDNSRAVLGLMEALAATGDRAGALEEARAHEEHLKSEYGAEPDPTVTAFARQLQEEPEAWAMPSAGEIADKSGGVDGGDGESRGEVRPAAAGWRPNSLERRGVLIGAGAVLVLLLLAGLYGRPGREGAVSDDRASLASSTAKHRQVTFTGETSLPAVSPGGESIAYRTSFGRGDERLYVQDLSGGEPLEIGRYNRLYRIRWSPTGEDLLVHVGRYQEDEMEYRTLLVPRLGGSSRTFPEAPQFDWSPDGQRFVYAHAAAKRLSFRDVSTGDTTSVALPDSFTFLWDVDWSHSGDLIAYVVRNEPPRKSAIWMIGLSGEDARLVVEDDLPMWSPQWSLNDDAIYYIREGTGTADLMKFAVPRSSSKSPSLPQTLMTGVHITDFALFHDGRRILYTRRRGFSNLWLTTIGPAGSAQIKQLTTGTARKTSFSVSPDGRQVALSAGLPNSNIYVLPIEGGPMRQITHLEGLNSNPVWSPDGKEIAFSSIHGGKYRVWKVTADGGIPLPFEDTEVGSRQLWAMAWAPGRQILYQRPGQRNFHLLDPRTGAERPLVPNEEVGWMYEPRYSPDGTRVMVHWKRDETEGLWIISLEDGKQRLIDKGNLWPAGWSRDGEWVYAETSEGFDQPHMIRYPIGGGAREVVTPLACGNGGILSVGMTPDAKAFLCLGGESSSDLWIAEDFDSEVRLPVASRSGDR